MLSHLKVDIHLPPLTFHLRYSGYCPISSLYIVTIFLLLVIQLGRDTFRPDKCPALRLNFTLDFSIHCCFMTDPTFILMAEKQDFFSNCIPLTFVHRSYIKQLYLFFSSTSMENFMNFPY